MWNHTQFTELMIDLDIVHDKYPHGECDTESHGGYHHDCIRGSGNTDQQMIVQHIIHEVDQGNTRYDKQGTG